MAEIGEILKGLRSKPDPRLERPDPAAMEAAVRGFEYLAQYHRLDVLGLDNLPEGPAVLVGNHSGGVSPIDGTFLAYYYRAVGYEKPVYIFAHDLLFKHPWIARTLRSIGFAPAGRDTARRVLEAGHKMLVYPGGDLDNVRPYRDRGKIVLAGRQGFARLALEHGVPIVPVVSAGSHETFIVLSQGRRLARALGLPRLLRLHSLPIILALPWGMMVGPMALLPHLPLPSKVTVQIGQPISTAHRPSVDELYQHVEQTMQHMLDGLYAERARPVLG